MEPEWDLQCHLVFVRMRRRLQFPRVSGSFARAAVDASLLSTSHYRLSRGTVAPWRGSLVFVRLKSPGVRRRDLQCPGFVRPAAGREVFLISFYFYNVIVV